MSNEKEFPNNQDEIQKLKTKLTRYKLIMFMLVVIAIISILFSIFKSPEEHLYRTYVYENDSTIFSIGKNHDSIEVISKHFHTDTLLLYDKNGNKIGLHIIDSVHFFDKQGNKLNSFPSTSTTIIEQQK